MQEMPLQKEGFVLFVYGMRMVDTKPDIQPSSYHKNTKLRLTSSENQALFVGITPYFLS
jgi:hypothetical protein